MAKVKPVSSLVNIVAWITGIIVSLAVGFGMIGGTLTVPYIGVTTVIAGWIVVVLTLLSVVLAIANKL